MAADAFEYAISDLLTNLRQSLVSAHERTATEREEALQLTIATLRAENAEIYLQAAQVSASTLSSRQHAGDAIFDGESDREINNVGKFERPASEAQVVHPMNFDDLGIDCFHQEVGRVNEHVSETDMRLDICGNTSALGLQGGHEDHIFEGMDQLLRICTSPWLSAEIDVNALQPDCLHSYADVSDPTLAVAAFSQSFPSDLPSCFSPPVADATTPPEQVANTGLPITEEAHLAAVATFSGSFPSVPLSCTTPLTGVEARVSEQVAHLGRPVAVEAQLDAVSHSTVVDLPRPEDAARLEPLAVDASLPVVVAPTELVDGKPAQLVVVAPTESFDGLSFSAVCDRVDSDCADRLLRLSDTNALAFGVHVDSGDCLGRLKPQSGASAIEEIRDLRSASPAKEIMGIAKCLNSGSQDAELALGLVHIPASATNPTSFDITRDNQQHQACIPNCSVAAPRVPERAPPQPRAPAVPTSKGASVVSELRKARLAIARNHSQGPASRPAGVGSTRT